MAASKSSCFVVVWLTLLSLGQSYDCPHSLRWRHNGHDCVWNHQPHHCLLNHIFGCRSKKTSKLRVTGLCAGNSPGPVNSPHKWPVTRKMFPFDDVIMWQKKKKKIKPWVVWINELWESAKKKSITKTKQHTAKFYVDILWDMLCTPPPFLQSLADPWWRHQMETFSALLAFCAENSPVPGDPAQRPVTRSFDVFFDLHKRLSKQSWGWWFETLSRSLWRHCNAEISYSHPIPTWVAVTLLKR